MSIYKLYRGLIVGVILIFLVTAGTCEKPVHELQESRISPGFCGVINMPQTTVRNDDKPVWSPDGTQIAFELAVRGSTEICVMDADGRNLLILTEHRSDDIDLTWSPDGTKIAFVSVGAGIYVIDSDGSNLKKLTPDEGVVFCSNPQWSPDGEKIVFEFFRDEDTEIYVMNADGTNLVNLTGSLGADGFPVWSPDGEKIAFISLRDGNFEIYVMDADGSNQVNLSNNLDADISPVWSPDGEKIAFVSCRDGSTDICVINTDGTNLINITDNPAYDLDCAWSPDGEKIAFVSTRDMTLEIYIVNSDGENCTQVTDSDWNLAPAWSPDGKKLAFISNRHWNDEIYVMDADGSNQQRLTDNGVLDSTSVYGSRSFYYYQSCHNGGYFELDADGKVLHVSGGPEGFEGFEEADDFQYTLYAVIGCTVLLLVIIFMYFYTSKRKSES